MSDETATTDHGFIRAWAEAREGRPGRIEGHLSANGQPVLCFDFGNPVPGLQEIAWDEFFTIFELERLALEYRDTPGRLDRVYRLMQRSEAQQSA